MRVEFDPLYKSLEELGRESRSGNLDLYMSGRLGSGNVSLAGDFSNGEYPDITNGNGNGFARFEGLPIMSEDELQNVLEARFQNGASGAPENEDLPCKMEEDQDWSGSAARGSAGAQIDSTSGLAMVSLEFLDFQCFCVCKVSSLVQLVICPEHICNVFADYVPWLGG